VSRGAELKDLLRRRAAEARDRALDDGGGVSAEETDELERLARLVKILGQTEKRPRRRRWPIAAALAATLAVMSGLLFLRVSATNVDMDLEVDELGFVMARSETLNAAIPLVELGAAGLASLRMPRSKDSSGQVHSAADKTWSRIQLSVPEPGQGRMTLDPLTPAANTRIWLRKTRAPGQYSLSLQHDEIAVKLTLRGRLTLRSPAAADVERDFGRGKPMVLMGRERTVDFTMTVAEGARATFARVIPVSALKLLKAHQDTLGQTPIETSTIRAGTIHFSDLDDVSRPLRAGERLRLELSEGHIRALGLAEDHVAFSFHGRLTELTSGEGRGRRSLMPTYLEWLRDQYALSLLWGAVVYVFGLALAIMRWWRIAV
jgi:hypothetical protein